MTDNVAGAHPAGRILGSRLRVERTLGRGGFAITYLCRAGEYDKAFAVKEFLPISLAVRGVDGVVRPLSEDEQEMFDRGLADFIEEGRRLLKCRHPNVVQVEDFFEEYGTAYLVMECVEGETLSQHVAREGALSARQLVTVLLPVLDALQVVHDNELLHRDLTPNNIMLRGGDLASPVLIDFGAARHASAIRSYSIAQVCSDGYSPPEQYDFRGKQGPYSDIYALGCIAYRCLMGERTPFAVERLTQDPMADWAARFPQAEGRLLVPIISKAIAVEAADRHQSAAELRAEIEAVRRVWDELARMKASELTRDVTWEERTDGSLALAGTVANDEVASSVVAALRNASPRLVVHDDLRVRSGVRTARLTATQVLTRPSGIADMATRVAGDAGLPAGATEPMPAGTAAASLGATMLRWQRRNPRQSALLGAAAVLAVALGLSYGLWTRTGGTATAVAKVETGTSDKADKRAETPVDNPFQVHIELPRTRFKVGDDFSFVVKANKDCNFLIYTVSAADKVELHDPKVSGAFMGDPLLRAGERREIPVGTAPGRARINPPAGPYQIGAVCGREDLDKLGIGETQLRRPAQEGRRSFAFTIDQIVNRIDRSKLARATVTYEVE